MAECLSKKQWREFIEDLDAFDIVFKAKKRHQTLLICEDGAIFYRTEELEEAIEEWRDYPSECE